MFHQHNSLQINDLPLEKNTLNIKQYIIVVMLNMKRNIQMTVQADSGKIAKSVFVVKGTQSNTVIKEMDTIKMIIDFVNHASQ